MTSPKKTRPAYEVGYARPPVATRFVRGASGNPRGKAPGQLNLKTELTDALLEKIWVTENGARRRLPRQTVIVRRLVADAVKGDARAREQILRLLDRIEAKPDTTAVDLAGAAKDTAILARFRAEIIKKARETP